MGKVLQQVTATVDKSKTPVRLIYPEGWNLKIQSAALTLAGTGIVPVLVFRNRGELKPEIADKLETIVIEDYDLKSLANELYELRKAKGMTVEEAEKLVKLPNYFCTMLLHKGIAEGYVGGIEMTTKDTLKPALQIIKSAPTSKIVTSCFIMERADEKYIWGDCGIIAKPSAEELCEIAKACTIAATAFGFETLGVALLSYSTSGSGSGESPDRVRQAAKLLATDPAFKGIADGEYQFDSAFAPSVRKQKFPDSRLSANKPADIFVFPDLDAGNIGYKIAQRLGNFEATGPILLGMNKPVNDLSRGASTQDIINVSYITAMQALHDKKSRQ